MLRLMFQIDEAAPVYRRSMEIREGSDILADNFVLDREFGIGNIISTQRIDDLSRNVIANCSRKIEIGGLGHGADYRTFGLSIGLNSEKIEFIKTRTLPGQACISDFRYPNAFTATIPYFPFDKIVSDEVINNRLQQYEAVLYLPDLPESESNSTRKDRQSSHTHKTIKLIHEAKLVLEYLSTSPNCMTPQTLMFKKLNIKSGAKMKKIKTELLINKLITEYQIQMKKTKLNFWEVTSKARELFDLPELNLHGKGGFCHKLIAYYIEQWAKQNNYTCKIEATIGNNKQVDALLIKDTESLIFEVCISEPFEKELNNIHKNFSSGFEYSKMIFLTLNSKAVNKLRTIIANDLLASQHSDKIEVKLAGDYINVK